MKNGVRTLDDMRRHKELIERSITDMLNGFQDAYGVPVNSLSITMVHGILPEAIPKIVGVKFNIEL